MGKNIGKKWWGKIGGKNWCERKGWEKIVRKKWWEKIVGKNGRKKYTFRKDPLIVGCFPEPVHKSARSCIF